MGFLLSADTVTITAKLTPFGRQQLLMGSNNIIKQFSLGDSDANYLGNLPLKKGEVPSASGEIGFNNSFSNGVYSGVVIKSPLLVNSIGQTKKVVESTSTNVLITPKHLGVTAQTSSTLNQLIVNRTEGNTDSFANLFKTFGLPLTTNEKRLFNSTTYVNTAIKNINQDKILVLSIDKCDYGEIIDGKTIKVELTTSNKTYNIYSTFQKTSNPSILDTQLKDVSDLSNAVNNNIAFLFSDDIGDGVEGRPNQNPNKSWATGYNTVRPFSLNGKEMFNGTSVTTTNTNADRVIGVAYLDKGFIIITNPEIVDNFDVNSNDTIITYNSVSNEVAQDVKCVIERDEFTSSLNSTYEVGDSIRVSEIALYDNSNNVIAYAKSNEHIIIGTNQYLILGIRILV